MCPVRVPRLGVAFRLPARLTSRRVPSTPPPPQRTHQYRLIGIAGKFATFAKALEDEAVRTAPQRAARDRERQDSTFTVKTERGVPTTWTPPPSSGS